MREVVFDGRAMLTKGIIVAVDDTGAAQTVDVLTQDGALFGALEVIQLFGHASVPPADGGQALVLAIGGDPANRVAIPFNPAVRFGNLAPGESVLYGADGSRVGVRTGGTVEVLGMSLVTLQSPEINLAAPLGVTITGPVTINGPLTVTEAATLASGTVTGDWTVGGTIHGHVTP
jgi:phage baseplate assembly protein V